MSEAGPVDHSRIYRIMSLRSLPHRRRLQHIRRLLSLAEIPSFPTYADFGCSNGYVTEIVRKTVSARKAVGYDHNERHFARGWKLHPEITFRTVDLNRKAPPEEQYDLVTCFETFEHVGSLRVALENVTAAIAPRGVGIFSVPIEIGPRGILKFYAKRLCGYDLDELPQTPRLEQRYVRALWTRADIGVFRDDRPGWATHFGFDYRVLDSTLEDIGVPFRACNRATTRFYLLKAR